MKSSASLTREGDLRTDVLVVGGGPAGAVAAAETAAAGVDVLILEKDRFPREKVCGDALLPDSLNTLREIGVLPEVEARGHRLSVARVHAPNGRCIRLRSEFFTIRRSLLDHCLVGEAARRGAVLLEGSRVEGPVLGKDGAVVGVMAKRNGKAFSVRAPVTILATGASSLPLIRFGVCRRKRPSAVGARTYYRIPALDPRELVLSFERAILPGYGWVFPIGSEYANVGCGLYLESSNGNPNLRELLDSMIETSPHISKILAGASREARISGAPIRCDLEGSGWWKAGLLVAGESLGATYALTGEGIGKAMESGLVAGRLAARAVTERDLSLLSAYPALLERRRFPQRFAQYRAAQRWISHPVIANGVGWALARSQRLRSRFEALLREELAPGEVLSTAGLLRALRPRLRREPH